jgi:hypothetical protein
LLDNQISNSNTHRNNKKKGRNNKGDKKTKVQKKIEKESNNPRVKEMYRQLKADGCRISFGENGATRISHPCMTPDADMRVFSDRGLTNMKDRRLIVSNYIHNYEEDLRQGVFEGTSVIAKNLVCEHLGSILCDALLEKDIHIDILRFLEKADKKMSAFVKSVTQEMSSLVRDLLYSILFDIS